MANIATRFRNRHRVHCAALILCALSLSYAPAKAETTAPALPEVLTLGEAAQLLRIAPGELEQLARKNEVPARAIGTEWRFNREALLAWINGDWTLIATAVPPSAEPAASLPDAEPPAAAGGSSLNSQQMAQVIGAGTAPTAPAPRETGTSAIPARDQTPNSEPGPAANGTPEPIGEAPEERTAEDVFLRGTKILLAPGEVALDVGQFYSRSDSQQLAVIDESVGLATIEERTFTTLLLGRVGVSDETELFASTTFRDQNRDAFFGSSKLSESSRSGFGDIHLGLRRTLWQEGPGRPAVIATIDGRIPTGDTSYALGGGLVAVKSFDPVVLFANANYHNIFNRNFSDPTLLEPDGVFDVSLGYALALNDTLTISTLVSGVFSSAASFDDAALRRQEQYNLQFGLTSWLATGLYIEPSVSFGLSGPRDSVAFGVTLPYTF
jgi:excisionase family DNA binding protein